jgi:hypothetical protein
MEQNLLNLKRRHVLGNIYSRCENIDNIPVYLDELSGEPIGFADESLGRYIDAFSFHLPNEICKKLSSNGYIIAVDYKVSEDNERMYKINHFVLLPPTNAVIAPKKKIEVAKV